MSWVVVDSELSTDERAALAIWSSEAPAAGTVAMMIVVGNAALGLFSATAIS